MDSSNLACNPSAFQGHDLANYTPFACSAGDLTGMLGPLQVGEDVRVFIDTTRSQSEHQAMRAYFSDLKDIADRSLVLECADTTESSSHSTFFTVPAVGDRQQRLL